MRQAAAPTFAPSARSPGHSSGSIRGRFYPPARCSSHRLAGAQPYRPGTPQLTSSLAARGLRQQQTDTCEERAARGLAPACSPRAERKAAGRGAYPPRQRTGIHAADMVVEGLLRPAREGERRRGSAQTAPAHHRDGAPLASEETERPLPLSGRPSRLEATSRL